MRLVIVGLIALLAGFGAGFFASKSAKGEGSLNSGCPERYKYINDFLDCEPIQILKKTEYTQLAYELEEYIEQEKKKGNLSHVSVYFRDLVGGPTFGIDSDETFVPASLLKVPMMVTYFSLAEKKPDILLTKTSYSSVTNSVTQTITNSVLIQKDTPYSVDELIRRMIVNSDNLAYGLLDKHLERLYPGKNIYMSILKELGLVNPRSPSESTFTVKTYSSLFRQLFNASYLTSEMSEKALDLLTQSKFDKALAAGIPKTIAIAHKFGEREGLADNEKQFHDCGIIYYPDNPYLLCVMTRGRTNDSLTNTIRIVSQKVYEEVDSRRF